MLLWGWSGASSLPSRGHEHGEEESSVCTRGRRSAANMGLNETLTQDKTDMSASNRKPLARPGIGKISSCMQKTITATLSC